MARIWNDGFEKLKGKRVEIDGSQLPDTVNLFKSFMVGESVISHNCTNISSSKIRDGNEWSPKQWLPQAIETEEALKKYEDNVRLSLYRAVTALPDLAEAVLDNFTNEWKELEDYEYGLTANVSIFFDVKNGKSTGEKNYREGEVPYISSGDSTNSIIRLVAIEQSELFEEGGITVTAFGQAYVQPWPFMARGNGGSSVRVLIPKYKMSFNELVWFASQINAQRWRFFYGRMSIKSRLERLEITSPPARILDTGKNH